MGEHTNISWCDHTYNPWIGCTHISDACDHCYAERDFDKRKGWAKWGAGNPRSRTSVRYWRQPCDWKRQHRVPPQAVEWLTAKAEWLLARRRRLQGVSPGAQALTGGWLVRR
jgi:protein gp37